MNMVALSVGEAKTIAVVVIVALLALALTSALVVKALVQKFVLVGVLVVLAIVVWSQRSSLDDCADPVRDEGRNATCSFFGQDVTISS